MNAICTLLLIGLVVKRFDVFDRSRAWVTAGTYIVECIDSQCMEVFLANTDFIQLLRDADAERKLLNSFNSRLYTFSFGHTVCVYTHSLRNVDIDKVVLVKGLKYDADDKEWSGAKIYDPTKGLKVNATAKFEKDGRLKLRGTILGIGKTLYWQKIK